MVVELDIDRAPSLDPKTPTPGPAGSVAARWHPVTRILFRFCLVYFVLYCLGEPHTTFAYLGILGGHLPVAALLWQLRVMRPIESFAANDILHVSAPFPNPLQTVDCAYIWVLLFCFAVAAVVATVVWSVLDRRRMSYVGTHKWFLVFIRFALAGQLLDFGVSKVIPLQMQLPLVKLVEPFGDFSPMSVLWNQVGSSQPYEILLGCAEVTAALLLIVPRTATAGALLALVDTAQVLLVNMAFDVPAISLAIHLILLSLIVLAPQLRRLLTFFGTNRAVPPPNEPALLRTRRGVRIAVAAQIVLGLWIAGSQFQMDAALWQETSTAAARPPLYGIWNVVGYEQDGVSLPPLAGDANRWYRFVVDTPKSYHAAEFSTEGMDQSIDDYAGTIDASHHAIVMEKLTDPHWMARLGYRRSGDQLTLDGTAGTHHVHVVLRRVDLATFPAVSHGFQWVEDSVYMR